MYKKLKEQFMINGPILGYLLNAISECNVKHFNRLLSDNYHLMGDPRISFNFSIDDNIYGYSIERITDSSPGVLTIKIFYGALEVYTITFWNIFLSDKFKITSSLELTNMSIETIKLFKEYDEDLRAIEHGLKEHIKKLIDETINTSNDSPIYVLMRSYPFESVDMSTDKCKLERLREAICKREDVNPDRFMIVQYEEYDDSYVSNLPEDPVYLIRFNENYEIIKNLCPVSRRDTIYASILDLADEMKFVNEHGAQCEEFIDKIERLFYCRASAANIAVIKYRKFIEKIAISNK